MKKQETQLSAICKALLAGDVLSIMDGFSRFHCTNVPREISRGVEQKFGVVVSRTPVKHKSEFNHIGVYFQYRLNRTKHNAEGIKKMAKYVLEHEGKNIFNSFPKTDKEAKDKKRK